MTMPELVMVVPELSCMEVCEQAFNYPWTLLVEKPVGHTLDNAIHLECLAVKLRAKVYVALNRRFYGSTQSMAEKLDKVKSQRVVTILDQEDMGSISLRTTERSGR